ncbi:tRNA (adenosine(37)-N6)-dimethylallyltransferase MiaA [Actinoplanes sp. N902-109]|uniref:tRNA (adenosine(37)-N6)-dimethylallyltransferase MiaA n=1 Tax=Actinoplanes sp. (strain N902-109) TaxID=649831 RepID=UPI000329438E|nr:tRNA delta(2)-isopentenylpyrophosphate transferase [Actinoplanes sp. N902-109]
MTGVPLLPPPGVVAVVGPTATGKTALSLALAHELGGEVINADSMQLYRGMDIGTAKLSSDEREGVPHHALDLWDVTVPASVAEYQKVARAAVEDVAARGLVPLLVGGSGLYVRAVLEEFDFPGTDPAIRERLEAELARTGPAPLYERLRAADPEAAGKILASNGRRIVRALEVIEMTGSTFTAHLPDPRPYYPAVQIGVDRVTAELDQRIADRVELMWRQGLLDEVRALDRIGLREGRTAGRALGYQQALAELDGTMTGAQARAATTQATRRFVRRQRSWFHRDNRITWLDGAGPELIPAALAAVRGAAR